MNEPWRKLTCTSGNYEFIFNPKDFPDDMAFIRFVENDRVEELEEIVKIIENREKNNEQRYISVFPSKFGDISYTIYRAFGTIHKTFIVDIDRMQCNSCEMRGEQHE